MPELFDEQREEWAADREQLRGLLDEEAYAAARRTTINAHYTDPAIAREMWRLVTELGFSTGRVLEPGCGAGVFLALAPDGAQLTGVELDPTTAAIARALHPAADIRAESFAHTRLPDGHFDLAIGNVPFADVRLHDPTHNRARHSLHNHFIIKALALTRPGGLVALLTSHYTLDAANPAARREMRQLADLVGAVRLPTGAHRRAAGTDALTDLLILRRREPHTPPAEGDWELTREIDVNRSQVRINAYLAARPQRIARRARGRARHVRRPDTARSAPRIARLPARRAARRCLAGPRGGAHERTGIHARARGSRRDRERPRRRRAAGGRRSFRGPLGRAHRRAQRRLVHGHHARHPRATRHTEVTPPRAASPARAARQHPPAARRRGSERRGHRADRRAARTAA